MIVLFTGSRDWTNVDKVVEVMLELPPDTVIVHGGARGLDTIVDRVAKAIGLKVIPYPADWSTNDAREGLYRNSQMLHESKPDKVLGFRTKLNSKGTNDMLKKAGQSGIPHEIYDDWEILPRR